MFVLTIRDNIYSNQLWTDPCQNMLTYWMSPSRYVQSKASQEKSPINHENASLLTNFSVNGFNLSSYDDAGVVTIGDGWGGGEEGVVWTGNL